LPLAPLSKRWARVAGSLPESEARVRMRVMEFMRDVERQSGELDWSVTAFPHTHRAWAQDVGRLRAEEVEEALSWCLEQFAETGVNSPEEASAFVSVWSAAGAGTPERIADAVGLLVRRRDPVTRVLTMMAFARCALEGTRRPESYGLLVRAMLDDSDRKTRGLFEEHLEGRFARRDRAYTQRLRLLCDAAGLERPKSPELPARAATPQGGGEEAATWTNVTGILGTAKRSWRKWLGGSEERPQTDPGKKDE